MLCTKMLFVINFSTGQREMMKTYLEIMSIIPILKQFANLGRRCGMIIGGSRGGHARRAPPHLPGILVFDDILGHIV